MGKHVLCDTCIADELVMASACRRKWREARASGEVYTCTCPLLPCETDQPHAAQQASEDKK